MAGNSNGHAPRRFLFSTSPFYGHFHPLVPLACALKDAGHEVAFAAGAAFEPVVRTAGFTFFPAGVDREKDAEYQTLMARLATMPPGPESERAVMSQIFAGVNPRLITPDLVAIGRAWQADMFIREGAEFGAVIAAEHLGLPHADVVPAAWVKGTSVFLEGTSKYLDPVRRSWGLEPDPTYGALYRYLSICYAPPSFSLQDVGVARSYPATTQFIHPVFFDQGEGATLPAWVSRLPDRPTVYVTLGTEVVNMPGFYPGVFQAIIAGLRDEPVNLIVTVGRRGDPADFGAQPPNVHIERYIPQSLLLPYCQLVVSHGGSNTLLETLDAGLPMVLIPLYADQFFNAAIWRSMELGPVVEPGQLTPDAVRAAARAALHNPAYRQNVKCLQAEMHVLPGLDYAVRLVEEVAARGQSVGPMAIAELSATC